MAIPRVPESVAGSERVRTAVILAAGTGSRLRPGPDGVHKCLTEIDGVSILQRQLWCLERWSFEHLIVVVGHQGAQIRELLGDSGTKLKITYVENPRYRTTNNLFSLWCARGAIAQPFLLLECDLVFDAELLAGMLHPDRIAVAMKSHWMRGTTVTLDTSQLVRRFHLPPGAVLHVAGHKTVNIYSLSLPTWRRVARRLESHVAAGRVHDYYEAVFRDMTADGTLHLRAVPFDRGRWYEIDTREDVRLAEQLFARSGVALGAPPPGGRPLRFEARRG